ncbi:MAG: S49 family peptidase, partial [Bacteroidota bacterium]
MKFLRNLLAALVALMIFFGFGTLLFFMIFGAITAEEPVNVKDNSILKIKLNVPVGERSLEDPLAEALGAGAGKVGVIEMTEAIAYAKDDDKIKGIYLDASVILAGYAQMEEIREALIDFRTSGKFVVTYSEIFSEGAYYLASAADKIFLNPQGQVEFNGLSAQVMFFKGTFEKLGVEAQVFKVGDFKSAIEPFVRTDMSDSNKLQVKYLLDGLYDHTIENIAEQREMDKDELMKISDEMLVRNAKDALKYGLVDELTYYDQVL